LQTVRVARKTRRNVNSPFNEALSNQVLQEITTVWVAVVLGGTVEETEWNSVKVLE
jgi:hypothetical protein